jgi:hypothetical protein
VSALTEANDAMLAIDRDRTRALVLVVVGMGDCEARVVIEGERSRAGDSCFGELLSPSSSLVPDDDNDERPRACQSCLDILHFRLERRVASDI